MRILHVADLHQNRGWFAWVKQQAPKYDAVVIAGDLLNLFDRCQLTLPDQIKWTTEWLREFPSPVFVCSGNHDFFAGTMGNEIVSKAAWLRRCARPNIWLDGQSANIGGFSWAVLSWDWRKWPQTADIVVVHAPPAASKVSVEMGHDAGDTEVRKSIFAHRPRWVLSGHVHEASGWASRIGDTWCFNPLCDLTADAPNFVVLDTTASTATWHTPDGDERLNLALPA